MYLGSFYDNKGSDLKRRVERRGEICHLYRSLDQIGTGG